LLQAGDIDIARAPESDAQQEPSEPFDPAALPLAVRIAELSAPNIRVARELAGREAALALTGSAALDPEAMDARLGVALSRLDGEELDGVRLDAHARNVDEGFALDAALAGLEAIDKRVRGRLALAATLGPDLSRPAFDATLTGSDLALMDKRFDGARLTAQGGIDSVRLALTGSLDGAAIDVAALVENPGGGAVTLRDLVAEIGETRASGTVTLRGDGLAEGALTLASDDLSGLGALLLVDAAGALDATIGLSAEQGQAATIEAKAQGLVYDQTMIRSAQASLSTRNLLSKPEIAGRLAVEGLASGEVLVNRLELTAASEGEATRLVLAAELAQGKIDASGAIRHAGEDVHLGLDRLDLTGPTELRLASPAALTLSDGVLEIPGATVAVGDGSVQISGSAGETLDLTAAIHALPLAIANAFAPDLGVAGSLAGAVTVTGAAAEPRIDFALRGQGLTARPARDAGAPALDLDLKGAFAEKVAAIDGKATGAGGLALAAKGAIPIEGPGVDLHVTGSAPLSLADRLLADRAARASGVLRADMRVSGAIDAPLYSGQISADGASFADGASGLSLTSMTLRARLDQTRVEIAQLTANSGGGRIAVTGAVGLDDGFPADLAIQLRGAAYEDGKLVSATADGDLTLKGELAAATVGGRIAIQRAEITIPEKIAGGGVAVDVEHQGEAGAVAETLRSAGFTSDAARRERGGSRGPGPSLDLVIAAPARIFLRGRGLDAEMGGEVSLSGPSERLAAQGAFEMRRGRMSILGQRIDFDRGSVTLDGDLDPLLDFAATTRGEGITVTATVTGRASDPQIALSSVPELPQDEVLAQFLFRRNVSELSPVQMAQLGAAAAELGGLMGGGPGVLGNLRARTGLDDLDVDTDAAGNRGVKAGRYINENIYLGVRGGEANSSGVTLDMNITDNLKARGETDATGNSGLGLFFEREY
jgi:translocation and assembly module TamB